MTGSISKTFKTIPTSLTWEDLPFDIHVRVISWLDPRSIVRLRMVCKTLRDITYERIIWINALVYQCDTLHTSYPFSIHPTTSVSEIESAVTASFRFVACLDDASDKDEEGRFCLKPRRKRSLYANQSSPPDDGNAEPDLSSNASPSSYFSYIHLVPGGRYLFTILGSVLIKAWDLNADPEGPPKELMGCLRVQEGHLYLYMQSAVESTSTENGIQTTTIVAVIQVDHLVESKLVYEIHRITVTSDSTDISGINTAGGQVESQKIAELSTNPYARDCKLHHGRGYLQFNTTRAVYIWDYCHDLVSTICTDDSSLGEVLLWDEYILTWNGDELLVYEIPPFLPVSSVNTGIGRQGYRMVPAVSCANSNHPRYRFPAPPPTRTSPLMNAYFISHRDNDAAFHLVVVSNERRGAHYRALQAISYLIISPTSPPTLASSLSLFEGDTSIDGDSSPLVLQRCNFMLQSQPHGTLLWFEPYSMRLKSLRPIPTSNFGLKTTSRSVKIWESRGVSDRIGDLGFVSFCTSSTRFCMITGEDVDGDYGEIGGRAIQIVDFI